MFIGYIKILKGNIIKFAHLADTHLGYRQFGLLEREKDFYEVFDKIIDKIIEEKVDFVYIVEIYLIQQDRHQVLF